MEDAIWHDDRAGWLPDSLEAERAADPDAMTIVVAESADEFVCADGSDSCRAPTSQRSGVEAPSRNGVVAASIARWSPIVPTSRPRAASAFSRWTRRRKVGRSCERMGFVAVTTTTPYIWTPPASDREG